MVSSHSRNWHSNFCLNQKLTLKGLTLQKLTLKIFTFMELNNFTSKILTLKNLTLEISTFWWFQDTSEFHVLFFCNLSRILNIFCPYLYFVWKNVKILSSKSWHTKIIREYNLLGSILWSSWNSIYKNHMKLFSPVYL